VAGLSKAGGVFGVHVFEEGIEFLFSFLFLHEFHCLFSPGIFFFPFIWRKFPSTFIWDFLFRTLRGTHSLLAFLVIVLRR
jgi:hypothetical protein